MIEGHNESREAVLDRTIQSTCPIDPAQDEQMQ